MNDSISRQAAIETVKKHYRVDNDLLEVIAYEIEALPSAQLAQDLLNCCTDTISRVAALSALNGLTEIYLNNLPPTIYKADAVETVKALPSAQQWTPCTPETMPDNEHDVLVTVEIRPVGRKPFRRVVRAFYTDGKHTDADSAYTWYELEEPDFDDDGNIIVPEGWWESSDYSEEVSPIDDFVISWREQPKPQKGEGNG